MGKATCASRVHIHSKVSLLPELCRKSGGGPQRQNIQISLEIREKCSRLLNSSPVGPFKHLPGCLMVKAISGLEAYLPLKLSDCSTEEYMSVLVHDRFHNL